MTRGHRGIFTSIEFHGEGVRVERPPGYFSLLALWVKFEAPIVSPEDSGSLNYDERPSAPMQPLVGSI